jgi:Xaa-Pro aminopeptidase
MKRAGDIAAKAFQDILPLLVPGTREKQVADALEIAMRARGAEKSSFDTIVASGIRSALPHGLATETANHVARAQTRLLRGRLGQDVGDERPGGVAQPHVHGDLR